MVTMTISLEDGAAPAAVKAAIRQLLEDRHGIGHVTIELDL